MFSDEDDFETRKMNMKRRFKRFFFTHMESDMKAMRLKGMDREELINVGINTFHLLSRLLIYFISLFIGSSSFLRTHFSCSLLVAFELKGMVHQNIIS